MSMSCFRSRLQRPRRSKSRGFTLMEMLITIAIVAILIGVALPSFRESMVRATVTQTGNDLVVDLNSARAEAVKRGLNTAVVAKLGSWSRGWEVRVDTNGNGIFTEVGVDEVLRDHEAIDPLYQLLGAPRGGGGATQVAYNGTGSVNGGAYDFAICRPRNTNAQNRAVLVDANGTISTQRRPPAFLAVTCP